METLTDMDASDIAPIPTQQPPCFQMKNSLTGKLEFSITSHSKRLKSIEERKNISQQFIWVQ
jgi:hypothetical protein